MRRVLFVDDEQEILDGLGNALRKHRGLWESVFVLGGQAALEEMTKGHFDVVITDMRMPGMDGATLLKIVQERYPATARIILSGYSEKESIVRSLPVAHQFLAKPCDSNILPKTIERVCRLQDLLYNEDLKKAMGNITSLPSPSATYRELSATILKPDFSMGVVAEIVSRDLAITAKILQIVNSPFFGAMKPISNISEAVKFLGVEMLRSLVLTSEVFMSVEKSKLPPGFSLDALQSSSILTSKVARRIIENPAKAEEASAAGLLHDIGKVILALCYPEKVGPLINDSLHSRKNYLALENESGWLSHAEVGAYLLGLWNLPSPIVEAVAFHHRPSKIPVVGMDVAGAVHIADWLVDTCFSMTPGMHHDVSDLDAEFISGLDSGAKMDDWKAMAMEEIEKCGKGF